MSSPSMNEGPASKNGVLTAAPRFTGVCQLKSSDVCSRHETQMSEAPMPPGFVLVKYIQWPSRENAGTLSAKLVLMTPPRFAGGPHGSSTLARVEIQMSVSPKPPGLFEWK